MKIFPIFIPFAGCPQRCIYCQQHYITKTSSTKNSFNKAYQPNFKEIREQLSLFCHKYDKHKTEIAFFGGSFTLLPPKVQQQYIDEIEQFRNEVSGIRISTRPDGINETILTNCANLGIKTIELGIQSFSDKTLTATRRSYTKKTAISACNLVKEKGFTLGTQLMPGLPGSDSRTLQETLSESISIKPSYIRIYPTIVLKNTELERIYLDGKYNPLTLNEAVDMCVVMTLKYEKEGINVIKTGLHSDLSATKDAVVAGPYHPAFGELVSAELLFRSLISESEKLTPSRMNNEIEKGQLSLAISDRAVSLFLGFQKQMLKRLLKHLSLGYLPVIIDKSLSLREFRFVDEKSSLLWR